MKRILITSALPYINGIKHLGNLVGSQLPADLYARYMRAKGYEVAFICATDEHGTPAELAASENQTSPEEYCKEVHPQSHLKTLFVIQPSECVGRNLAEVLKECNWSLKGMALKRRCRRTVNRVQTCVS